MKPKAKCAVRLKVKTIAFAPLHAFARTPHDASTRNCTTKLNNFSI